MKTIKKDKFDVKHISNHLVKTKLSEMIILNNYNMKNCCLFYLMLIFTFSNILTVVDCGKFKEKWIHAVGKEAKGDNIGTSLMNMQITTKSMLRPQKWFFNAMTSKPSIKYIKEAEEDGLKYQIELLRNKLDSNYDESIRDLYDQKLLNTEQKIKNKFNIVNVIPSPTKVTLMPANNLYLYDTANQQFISAN
jgi:hypothetical protein